MKNQNQNPILNEAARGGVVRTWENSRQIDRLLASGLLEVSIRDDRAPISSKCYILSKKGKKLRDAQLPKLADEPEITDKDE